MMVIEQFRTLQETCVKKELQVDNGFCHVGRRAQIQMKVNTSVDIFNCCISLDNSCSVFLRCLRKRERV
jgi:hypothetical protein